MLNRRALLAAPMLFAPAILRHAQAAQAPGVTATSIKVGNTMP